MSYPHWPTPLWRMAPRAAQSCSDVAARSEVVITMLPDGPEVEQAVLGPNGVLEGARRGPFWWT